jgi:hypothetical protein
VINYNIREGDIILFSFNPKSDGRLNLVIMDYLSSRMIAMLMPA